MPAKSTVNAIVLELNIARAFAHTAESALSAGNATKGDEAMRDAWTAWEHAAREVLKHNMEALHPKILAIQDLLWRLEARPLSKSASVR
jgi:hypothetical protein